MSINFNHITIAGRLVRDPELKSTPSGQMIANFSIATSRSYKAADGTRKEQTEYVNIVVFGKSAEISNQYLKKGQECLVSGRLATRSWEDKEGKKQYRTEVIAEHVQFGARAKNDPRPGENGEDVVNIESGAKSAATTKPSGKNGGIEYPKEETNPEDIPF